PTMCVKTLPAITPTSRTPAQRRKIFDVAFKSFPKEGAYLFERDFLPSFGMRNPIKKTPD
ncbi:hypothetical protein, partial [Mucilaginibacter galii]|uniref:hypothetical protein n=1 Tax=Mucilaginibacter galii TaxID=2005073 RepID=UPI0039EF0C4D